MNKKKGNFTSLEWVRDVNLSYELSLIKDWNKTACVKTKGDYFF